MPEIKKYKENFYDYFTKHKNGCKILENSRYITKSILFELKDIKLALEFASRDIEKVFKKPLAILFNQVYNH